MDKDKAAGHDRQLSARVTERRGLEETAWLMSMPQQDKEMRVRNTTVVRETTSTESEGLITEIPHETCASSQSLTGQEGQGSPPKAGEPQ